MVNHILQTEIQEVIGEFMNKTLGYGEKHSFIIGSGGIRSTLVERWTARQ